MTTTSFRDQHDEAVLQAEVKRLVNALRPFGVLHRDVLQREACAGSWHEGGFDRALAAAVAAHEIHELAFGYYGLCGSQTSA